MSDPTVDRIVKRLYGDDDSAAPEPGTGTREVVLELLLRHRLHPSMNICAGCDWRATPDIGSLADQHAAHLADVLTRPEEVSDAAGGESPTG